MMIFVLLLVYLIKIDAFKVQLNNDSLEFKTYCGDTYHHVETVLPLEGCRSAICHEYDVFLWR